jgi:hypothetical protein
MPVSGRTGRRSLLGPADRSTAAHWLRGNGRLSRKSAGERRAASNNARHNRSGHTAAIDRAAQSAARSYDIAGQLRRARESLDCDSFDRKSLDSISTVAAQRQLDVWQPSNVSDTAIQRIHDGFTSADIAPIDIAALGIFQRRCVYVHTFACERWLGIVAGRIRSAARPVLRAARKQYRAFEHVGTFELPWPGRSNAAARQFGQHFAWCFDHRFLALGHVVWDGVVAIAGAVDPSARLFSARWHELSRRAMAAPRQSGNSQQRGTDLRRAGFRPQRGPHPGVGHNVGPNIGRCDAVVCRLLPRHSL